MNQADFTQSTATEEITIVPEKYQSKSEDIGEKAPFTPREDVPRDIKSWPVPADCPQDYRIVVTDPKGRVSIDRNAILDYLSSRYIVFDGDQPFQFDGCIYRRIDLDRIARLIYMAVDSFSNAPFLSKSSVADIIAKFKVTRTAGDINHFYQSMGWEDYEWQYQTSEDCNLIPFLNGLYNIETDTLLPFSPAVFITFQLQVFYDPSIKNHPVESIYKGIIPDDRTRAFYWQMVGYTLFSVRMLTPAIFLIYGGGNTGKSALQETVATALGREYVATLGLNQISDTFLTSQLRGKLMNACGETGDKSRDYTRVDGELLKKLSDGQPVTAQVKYGQPFQMSNSAKLWFVSNTTPDFGDNSSGLYRRMYIIPCRQTQSWEAQIYAKMQTSDALSWLVNKALDGFRRFLKNSFKFDVSPEMQTEMKFFTTQDNLMDFIYSEFQTTEKTAVRQALIGRSSSLLYENYKSYLEEFGARPLSRKKFTEKIRNEYNLKLKTKNVEILGKGTTRSIYADKDDDDE